MVPQFLVLVCNIINLRPSGRFCTNRVTHICLSFVDQKIELTTTYNMIKPHMNFLLYKVGFPAVCLTPKDIYMFDCDPHDFVQHQNSLFDNFYNPHITAITLITYLVKHRGKDVTQGLLEILMDIMSHYAFCCWFFSSNAPYLRINFPRTCRVLWLHLSTQTSTVRWAS